MPVAHLLLTAALALSTPAPLWDHAGYDAEDSHYNPRETAITVDTIPTVTRKWQVKLRTDDESCSGFAHPVLTAGRIHVSDQLGVSTYDTDTGKTLWRYGWEDKRDNGTPRLAVSDGLVIVAANDCNSQSDPDGHLIALDARTGLPRWRQSLGIPVNAVVVDKGVVVVSGGSPSDGDRVVAVAVRDGRELWSRENALASEVSANGTLLIRTTDESGDTGSAAVSVVDGRDRWNRKTTWTAQAADPGGEWFYATDETGALVAVRVSDGSVRWTVPSFSADPNSGFPIPMAVDGNRIYRVSGRDVRAFHAIDGTTAWNAGRSAGGTQPVRAGDLLYAGSAVLNPGDGTVAGPAFAGEVLVTGGRIHQLDQGVLTTWAS